MLVLRSSRSLRAACIFIFSCLNVFFFTGCERNIDLDPLTVKIADQVRVSVATKLNLAELTDFDWDKVYFFSPKQTRDEMCKQVNLSEKDCSDKIADQSIGEDYQYLIFTKADKVTRVVRHKRFFGDFNPPPKTAVAKSHSEFKIYALQSTASGVPWYVLRQN